MERKYKLDWQEFAARASILSACFAILAVSIASPLYLGAKIDNLRNEMYQEMKDFHGRMAVLEDRYLRIREKE